MYLSLKGSLGHTAITDRVGESLLQIAEGSSAAYSLRNLGSDSPSVVRVRRESDNAERDFSAQDINTSVVENWVNQQIIPPLDLRELTPTGRDGPLIPAAAAYSLRNLSNSYTGNVVKVRRNSDDAEADFTAVEVSNGTLLNWVNADIDKLDLQTESGGLTGNVTNETATGFDFSVNNEGSYGYKNITGLPVAGTYVVTFNAVLNSGSLSDTWLASTHPFVMQPLQSGANSVAVTVDGTGNIYFLVSGTAVADVSITNLTLTQTTADGHVSTWYDQSGNTKHATQGTPASQPKVVDAGVFLGEILFDGVDDYIDIAGLTTLSNPFTFFQVVDLDGGAAFRPATDGITGSNSRVITGNGLGSSENDSMYAGLYLQNTPVVTDLALRSYFFKGDSSSSYFRNGSQGFVGDVGAQKPSSGIRIAADHDLSGDHSNIRFKEFIVYDSDQAANRTAFEANIGEVYGIAGIPAYDNTVNGFVETWYDQSGNGNDASQLTASQQPKIVDTGVLVLSNGDAAIKSTASNGLNFSMASLSADGQQSVFSVLENDVTSQDNFSSAFAALSNSDGLIGENRRPYWFIGPSGALVFSVDSLSGYTTANRERRLYSHIMEDTAGGTSTVYQDGTQVDTRSITLDANPNFIFAKVGSVGPNAVGALYTSEVIYYPSDESVKRPAIEDNIDNHYGITSAGSYVNAAGDSYINAAGDTYLQP